MSCCQGKVDIRILDCLFISIWRGLDQGPAFTNPSFFNWRDCFCMGYLMHQVYPFWRHVHPKKCYPNFLLVQLGDWDLRLNLPFLNRISFLRSIAWVSCWCLSEGRWISSRRKLWQSSRSLALGTIFFKGFFCPFSGNCLFSAPICWERVKKSSRQISARLELNFPMTFLCSKPRAVFPKYGLAANFGYFL